MIGLNTPNEHTSLLSENTTRRKQYNKRVTIRRVIFVTLSIAALYAAIFVMIIEIKGHKKLIKTHDEWDQIISQHLYERRPTDLRSPCPMVNTLANHGFIARDGRNIKSGDFFDALMLLGAPPLVTYGFLNFVYSALKEPSPTTSFLSQFHQLDTLNLNRLGIYGIVEHDVSLTRNDSSQAPYDTTKPIPEYVDRLINLASVSNKGQDSEGMFTRKNENDARRLRWLESTEYNSKYHLSLYFQFASSTECSLLLDIFGRDGVIGLSHLKSFLLNETFPEGWYPRDSTYSAYELVTKPLLCWTGLHKSKVSLDLLKQIHQQVI